jgi:hypothetical protein
MDVLGSKDILHTPKCNEVPIVSTYPIIDCFELFI